MPRYLVERALSGVAELSVDEVVERNTDNGVTWMHSYVSEDTEMMLCLYEAPSPEAIRRAARRNDLPVERITKVRILDPYSYPDQRRSQ
jgi:Nickel responsive protein SCO4226-like